LTRGAPPRRLATRLGWFVGLWAGGVAAVVGLGTLVRLIVDG
jgi:hypothetical protein